MDSTFVCCCLEVIIVTSVWLHAQPAYTHTCLHTHTPQVLLEAGAEASARITDLSTPLHHAGSAAVARALLAAGASPHARDRYERTPLHAACRAGAADVVRVLLEAGADADARDDDDRAPLHVAVEMDRLDCVMLLLDGTSADGNNTTDNSSDKDRGHGQGSVLCDVGSGGGGVSGQGQGQGSTASSGATATTPTTTTSGGDHAGSGDGVSSSSCSSSSSGAVHSVALRGPGELTLVREYEKTERSHCLSVSHAATRTHARTHGISFKSTTILFITSYSMSVQSLPLAVPALSCIPHLLMYRKLPRC